jgi:excisionase family DNA binding protein
MESLLTARQVAERLSIKISTVYALCRRGDLPHVRLTDGCRALIRFDPSALEEVLRSRTVNPGVHNHNRAAE